MVKLFEGAKRDWKFVIGFIVFSIVFWLLQFAYQFYVLIPGEFGGSLVRSFALSGATFIGAALFSSSIFKWFPQYAKYWYVRRSLGVMGFTLTLFHVLSVTNFLFQWDVGGIFWSLNPFENPLIFGALAFPIFFLMAITSTDWAVEKLNPTRWKAIHRLVYFGYLFAVFHFLTINPELLQNIAGYLLLLITFLALAGEFYWFIRTAAIHRFSSLGSFIGFFIIFLYLLFGYFAFLAPALMQEETALTPNANLPLPEAVEKMKEFMEIKGGDKDVLTIPVEQDQEFVGELMKSGEFQTVNYMTSGIATLEQKDGKIFVVFNEAFSTPNGPDLVVYLTKNSSATTRNDISKGLELGELKSTTGKQVYEVSTNLNIEEFNSVSIHCKAFNVPWSFAPLS